MHQIAQNAQEERERQAAATAAADARLAAYLAAWGNYDTKGNHPGGSFAVACGRLCVSIIHTHTLSLSL